MRSTIQSLTGDNPASTGACRMGDLNSPTMQPIDKRPVPLPRITLDLPYPVSVNAIWRQGRRHVHKSQRYQEWITQAGLALIAQRPKLACRAISGPYIMVLEVARPDKRRRDLWNLEKAVSDLLVLHKVIDDDHLCELGSIRWSNRIPTGTCRVTVIKYRQSNGGIQSPSS